MDTLPCTLILLWLMQCLSCSFLCLAFKLFLLVCLHFCGYVFSIYTQTNKSQQRHQQRATTTTATATTNNNKKNKSISWIIIVGSVLLFKFVRESYLQFFFVFFFFFKQKVSTRCKIERENERVIERNFVGYFVFLLYCGFKCLPVPAKSSVSERVSKR